MNTNETDPTEPDTLNGGPPADMGTGPGSARRPRLPRGPPRPVPGGHWPPLRLQAAAGLSPAERLLRRPAAAGNQCFLMRASPKRRGCRPT